MTAPRQVLPGATYHVTRRCTRREYLLRPSKATNDILLFLLAVAACRYGVQVHAFCVMSNHLHLIVTDPDARLPAFHQFLDALIARSMNAALGRWESFWDPNSYTAVRILSPQDIVEETAYVLANPVAAGLVRSARMWPGQWSDPERFGTRLDAQRPQHFFSADGALPPSASLELAVPPGFSSAAEFSALVATALAEREEQARRRIGRSGFLGVARVLAQSTRARPASVEPRRNLRPRVASRDALKRIEALTALGEFVRRYREAWAKRRAGQLGALFPPGTYLLRVMHGVPCAEFG